VAAAAVGFASASREQAAPASAAWEARPLLQDTALARSAFDRAERSLLMFMITGQPRYGSSYRNARGDLTTALARSRAIATGDSLRDVTLEHRAATAWLSHGDQAMSLRSGSPSRRSAIIAGDAGGLAFVTANARLQSRLAAQDNEAIRAGQAAVRSAVIDGGAAGILAVLLWLLAAFSATRQTAEPLSRVAATVRKLAAGDHAARAVVAGTAEARDVATSVNMLAEVNEREHRQVSESLRLGAAARQAGIRIRAHLDLAEMIKETVDVIEDFVPDDFAYLHLLRDGQVGLPEGHEHDWILPPEFAQFPTQIVPLMEDLLSRRSSQVLQDVTGPDAASVPPEHLAMMRQAGVVSFLVTPVGIGPELAGLIVAIRRRPGHQWTAGEIDAFQQIAADVGRALQHSRQYEAENRLVTELQALDERKSNFIATVSHELRTPLTSITGSVEILRTAEPGPLTVAQARMLDVAERNAARLRRLIEDLLTLSEIESGAFHTSVRLVNLTEVMAAAAAALEPAAAAAGLTLTAALPPAAIMVSGDSGQLDRLLTNLLSNAVKFTLRGGRVQLSGTTDGDMAVITVTDSGIGIPEAEKSRIAVRFYRAANAVERAIPGTGLGLAIAYSIVANHGGDLAIESCEREGTTVTVRIPKLPAAETRAGTADRNSYAGQSRSPGDKARAGPTSRRTSPEDTAL
jgi:signal transduction histidine kinase/CHASE3 domain sensor protein